MHQSQLPSHQKQRQVSSLRQVESCLHMEILKQLQRQRQLLSRRQLYSMRQLQNRRQLRSQRQLLRRMLRKLPLQVLWQNLSLALQSKKHSLLLTLVI